MKRTNLPYLPDDLRKPSSRPQSGANEILNTAETTKETTRGRAHFFKVNGKSVAYFIGTDGKITKDELTQKQIRVIHNFFARNHVTYSGKIPQTDIESL
jgi:hypothetical protein